MQFVKQSIIHASPERVFEFHEQPDALELLTPHWEHARVVQPARISEVGSRAIVELRVLGLFPVRWVAEHTAYEPPHFFEDVQIEGPFRRWRQRHIVRPDPQGAVLRDEIDCEPPLGVLGRISAPLLVHRRLQKVFDYRHEVTRHWCERDLKK